MNAPGREKAAGRHAAAGTQQKAPSGDTSAGRKYLKNSVTNTNLGHRHGHAATTRDGHRHCFMGDFLCCLSPRSVCLLSSQDQACFWGLGRVSTHWAQAVATSLWA